MQGVTRKPGLRPPIECAAQGQALGSRRDHWENPPRLPLYQTKWGIRNRHEEREDGFPITTVGNDGKRRDEQDEPVQKALGYAGEDGIVGLDRFVAHYAGYEDRYALIGGAVIWLVLD